MNWSRITPSIRLLATGQMARRHMIVWKMSNPQVAAELRVRFSSLLPPSFGEASFAVP
jgi:hypothetical protein